MKTDKKEKKVVGGSTVTFWNLIRSYLLLHHPEGHALFIAKGVNNSNDFLHYSKCTSFSSFEELNEAFSEIDLESESGNFAIRISDGVILD